MDYAKSKRKNDIQYRIASNLRSRLRDAMKNNYKSGSAVRDLWCTIKYLKTYLENKFLPGMTWENYGYCGWHIDHIIPLVGFDLTDRSKVLMACHYTNLQPLWAKDNLIKGAKI